MSFDDDARPELAPVPLTVAPTREQRVRWLACAEQQGLDLHRWIVGVLEREAVACMTHATAVMSTVVAEPRVRQLVGAERGRGGI